MSTSDQFTVAFEVTQKSYEWWAPSIGLLFVLSGWIIARIFRQSSWALFRFWSWSGYMILAFASLGTLAVLCTTFPRYVGAQFAYRSGHYSVVEGNITDFDPMPYRGHRKECFTVSSQRFCYSDYEMTPGFNQTASHGGPIRDGLQVRISYAEGTILRLEIKAND